MRPIRPAPRGPRSEALFAHWDGVRPAVVPEPEDLVGIDPLTDDDLHLALWCCYQLDGCGFEGHDDGLASDRTTIDIGHRLEQAVEEALRTEHSCDQVPPDPVVALRVIATWAGPPLARAVEEDGERRHLQELAIHRSVQLLRPADPRALALSRLSGPARAALAPMEGDEPGRSVNERTELFAAAMVELGLDPAFGCYLDRLPGVTLATDNVISMFGRHRRLAGALVGHLALTELSRVEPMARYRAAARRIGGLPALERFYDAHLATGLQAGRPALDDLVGPLVAADPDLEPEVVFGAAAMSRVEARFERHVLSAWRRDESSLLPEPERPGARSSAAPPVAASASSAALRPAVASGSPGPPRRGSERSVPGGTVPAR